VSQPVGLAPLLQLQQLDLQQPLLLLVFGARHAVVVGVTLAPGIDIGSARVVHKHGVVVIVIADGEIFRPFKRGHPQTVSTRVYA
jgi:hypothetical protein